MRAFSAPPSFFQRFRRSLSAQLLGFTILFILFAEILVLIPAVSQQRIDWLNGRLSAAYLISLALEAPSEALVDPELARQIFSTASMLGVSIATLYRKMGLNVERKTTS